MSNIAFFVLFLLVEELLTIVGKRIFPVKRYYPHLVSFVLNVIINIVVIVLLIGADFPDWMSAFISSFIFAFIRVLLPTKPRHKSRKLEDIRKGGI